MNLKTEKMTLDDLKFLCENIKNFDDFWNENILKEEFYNPNSLYLVAKNEDNIIVAFAGIWKILDEVHITNIAVKKDFRNQGIGSKIFENLLKLVDIKYVNSITLEVSENNIPAIKIYEKCGFEKVGFRKNYYGNNNSAIIMTKYLF